MKIARCLLYDPTLNLAYSGDIYESELFWERDPNTLALMRRLGVGTMLAPSDATEAIELQIVGRDNDAPIEGVRVMAWLQSEEGLLPTQVWVTDRDGVSLIPLAGARPRYGILRLSHPTHVSRELKWHESRHHFSSLGSAPRSTRNRRTFRNGVQRHRCEADTRIC